MPCNPILIPRLPFHRADSSLPLLLVRAAVHNSKVLVPLATGGVGSRQGGPDSEERLWCSVAWLDVIISPNDSPLLQKVVHYVLVCFETSKQLTQRGTQQAVLQIRREQDSRMHIPSTMDEQFIPLGYGYCGTCSACLL